MMLNFFPVRKFKRNGRYIVFGAVLMFALLAAYLEFMAMNEWSSPGEWHLMPCHFITACWYIRYAHVNKSNYVDALQ